MYLSQCILNTTRPVNPYLLHKKIWKLFPEQQGEERSFLFRVENLGQAGAQKILLQSGHKPQAASGDLLLLQSKDLNLAGLKAQSKLRFMLRANPTKKIKDQKGKQTNQGKVRVPLIDEREITDWLMRQLQDCADINDDELVILRQDLLSFRKSKDKQQYFGKIQTITYTGIMTVFDHEILINKIYSGFGPAKAFGCGLLSIAKA
jgi:CRISPR system Cascade subunit CasE